jgi:toxin ParE1/3/4
MRSGRKLEFSPNAEDDLRSILDYSLTTWGRTQRDHYADRIMGALGELLVYPMLGSSRDDVSLELRMLRVAQHVVYYRVRPSTVRIVRILHAKLNPATHLIDPPGDERALPERARPRPGLASSDSGYHPYGGADP